MKRLLFVLLAALFLVACGGEESNMTMDSFVETYESEGYTVDSEKPFFQMIGAKDGISFTGDEKVVIYEFDSEQAISDAEEGLPATKGLS